MDCAGRSHIVVACEPLDIRMLHVQLDGPLNPLKSPRAHVTVVRELQMMNVQQPLMGLSLTPMGSVPGALSLAEASGMNGSSYGTRCDRLSGCKHAVVVVLAACCRA
jgi:hypothetical protein